MNRVKFCKIGLVVIFLVLTGCNSANNSNSNQEVNNNSITTVEQTTASMTNDTSASGFNKEGLGSVVSVNLAEGFTYRPPYNIESFIFQDIEFSSNDGEVLVVYDANRYLYTSETVKEYLKVTMISISDNGQFIAIELDTAKEKRVWVIDVVSRQSWVIDENEEFDSVKSPIWTMDHKLMVIVKVGGSVYSWELKLYSVDEEGVEDISTFGKSGDYHLPFRNDQVNSIILLDSKVFGNLKQVEYSLDNGELIREEAINFEDIPTKHFVYQYEDIYYQNTPSKEFLDVLDIEYLINTIYVQYADTSIEIQCSLEEDESISEPYISPDEQFIVFDTSSDNTYSTTWLVDVVNQRSWNLDQELNDAEVVRGLNWGPDNSIILFAGYLDNLQLCVLAPNEESLDVRYIEDYGEFNGSRWSVSGDFFDVVESDYKSGGFIISRYTVDKLEKLFESIISYDEYRRWDYASSNPFQ